MNKTKIIAGLNMILEALEEDNSVSIAEAPVKETVTHNEPVIGKLNEDELRKMKYNELKSLASKLGVNCKGTREEVIKRLMALNTIDPNEMAEEPVEETKSKPKSEPKKSKKSSKAEEEVEEPEDTEEDEFDVLAKEIAIDNSIEDIIASLKDVDIKATKKNAVEKLAEALREGLIEIDDDEEEVDEEDIEELDLPDLEEDSDEEDESDEDEITEEVEISEDSYFEQFDLDGHNNPDNMTDERAEAIKNKMVEILEAIENEELTAEDITSYIEDNASQNEIDALGDDYSDDDLIMLYMELVKKTIDNDGDIHEPSDPYEIGDENFCCGHELSYSKKTKRYICSICGTEYEAE